MKSPLTFMEMKVDTIISFQKTEPLRVFLSHSHKDNIWCDSFVEELKNNNFDVWYDREGLYVGSRWVKTLEQELQERDIYLIILTPDSWTSQWVQSELSLALGQRKQIIGILCKPTQVSGFLTTYQLLDATQLESKQAAQLLVASLNNTKPTSSPLVALSQTAPKATRGSEIDISGQWEGRYSRVLYLKQADTKITGSGNIFGTMIIDGSIDGINVTLKATDVYGKNYYEMKLTFVLHTGEMRGIVIEYKLRSSLFGKEKFVKESGPSNIDFTRAEH